MNSKRHARPMARSAGESETAFFERVVASTEKQPMTFMDGPQYIDEDKSVAADVQRFFAGRDGDSETSREDQTEWSQWMTQYFK